MQRASDIALSRAANVLFRRIGLPLLLVVLPLAAGVPLESVLAQHEAGQGEARRFRGEWRAQVEDSRLRVEPMRRERRSFVPPPPSAQELARENSKRVLEDDSLRDGDIVATDRGLLVFKGRSTPNSTERGDFVPLAPRQ